MQLEFKKQNGLYEVEFEVTGNFNLHLERKSYGRVELYQKTSSETNYTSSPSYSTNGDAVINLDFSMGIYPKFVKIVSYTEVEKAIVTMEGESVGSGAGVVDNPDDYEQEVLIEVVDYNDKVVASHVFNKIPKDDENDISEYTSLANKAMPAKSVLVTYRYIKDDVAIAFVPKNVKIFIGHYYENYGNEFFAQIPAQLIIENNTIILNWGDILKDCYVESGNDTRLKFSLKGEEAEIPFLIN